MCDVHLLETASGRTSRLTDVNPQVRDLFAFAYEDFSLEGYQADPTIRAPIAV